VAFLVVLPGPLSHRVPALKTGELVEADIVSPLTVEIEPKDLSESRRDELAKKIAPVFDYDDTALENWLQKWQQAFTKIHQEFYAGRPTGRRALVMDALSHRVFELTGQALTEPDLEYLHHAQFSPTEARLFLHIGEHLLGRLIAPTDLFPYYYSTGIIVRQLNHALSETFVYDLSRVWSLEQGAEYLSHIPSILGRENKPAANHMAEIISHVMVANLKFNAELTQKRTATALNAVNRTIWSVRKGQIVLHRGERVTDSQAELLHSLWVLSSPTSIFRRFGWYVLIFLVLLGTLLGANITRRGFRHLPLKDALCFMGLTIVTVVAVKCSLPYLRAITLSWLPGDGIEYLLPVSFGGIIVHLLMGREAAQTYATILAIILGALLDNSFGFGVWTFTVTVSAIQSVKSCKQRTDLFRCGAKSGLVGAVLVFGYWLVFSMGLSRPNWIGMGLTVVASFASGLLAAVISATLIPVFETVFGYTTSLKLLELSNFNHPLLHNLMMKAPGTYHHSIIVGSLAEIAADKVKANGLLARVSAYYHDIGKMNKPLYFIENQSPNNNPHDHLQPTMSAKILFSHVKNGARMAREYNLGAKITNIIEQHHGTTLVSFFFNKAKKLGDPHQPEIAESDFRYPGPKPQSREAAIVMLADACEAATRSIAEPTPAKIQAMVHNIINRRFLEQQFIECDLTFNDLSLIEEVFTRTLVSLYHHRIEYPGQSAQLGSHADPALTPGATLPVTPTSSPATPGPSSSPGPNGKKWQENN